MIPPRIRNLINDTVVKRGLFSYSMVRDTNVRDLFAQILNRKGCVGLVPFNKERLDSFGVNATVGKYVSIQRLHIISEATNLLLDKRLGQRLQ